MTFKITCVVKVFFDDKEEAERFQEAIDDRWLVKSKLSKTKARYCSFKIKENVYDD